MPPIRLPERLESEPVVLRPGREADVDAYAQAFVDDPELGPAIGIEADPDAERIRGWLAWRPQALEEGTFAELAVADPGTDAFRGVVVVREFDWHSLRAEIGFWLVAGARGRGTGSAALRLALDWLFDEVGLERVEMTTTTDNHAVHALARRFGFVREGVLRQRNLERGRRVDVVWFGLLRDERRAFANSG